MKILFYEYIDSYFKVKLKLKNKHVRTLTFNFGTMKKNYLKQQMEQGRIFSRKHRILS